MSERNLTDREEFLAFTLASDASIALRELIELFEKPERAKELAAIFYATFIKYAKQSIHLVADMPDEYVRRIKTPWHVECREELEYLLKQPPHFQKPSVEKSP